MFVCRRTQNVQETQALHVKNVYLFQKVEERTGSGSEVNGRGTGKDLVDECGINEHLKREYGRALRGVKVEDTKRGHKFHRVNVVAAVIHGKKETRKIAPECYNGSMTGVRFESWFEFKLLKEVQSGSAIIAIIIDLFDNPVGYLTVLQFFRLKALQNCIF